MPIIQLAAGASISAAGPVAGSVQATDAIGAKDYTLSLMLNDQTGGAIRIAIEDSADGSSWAPVAMWNISGPNAEQAESARSYNAPSLKTAAGAQARLNVYEISGAAKVTAQIQWAE